MLATDGSRDAALAARAAAELSARTGSELHVVHVLKPVYVYGYEYVPADVDLGPSREEAQQLLDTQVKGIERDGVNVAAAHLREGSPVDCIVDLAEEIGAGPVLVGRRGLGTVRRLLLGSVSEGVVHHASCPVLVVSGDELSWPPSRVVVGEDYSDEAESAGEVAAAIARACDAELVLVNASDVGPQEESMEADLTEEKLLGPLEELLQPSEDALEARAAKLQAILGKRPEHRLVPGDPAAALLGVAKEEAVPTMIAVGSRGHGMARRLLLGSVSTKVLRAHRDPVLVVPGHRRGGASR